jgi:hypothetical protein
MSSTNPRTSPPWIRARKVCWPISGTATRPTRDAPIIMMSQNRQQQLDRQEVERDFQINIKAELEIELLHQKIDALREKKS